MHEPLGVWRVYVHVLLHTRGFLAWIAKKECLGYYLKAFLFSFTPQCTEALD